ncbi:PREDICTED: polycystic kidney disease protein 1-like 2 [Branchiostoma belcheri]|uniref:Polycystic kidney disease protein 1-like 2 n=1 Tax=Branchiostoma belcheri TaxID=7741 RepID=A0A6P4YV04_BRABE|nr:PREDICTED: polycystic kidney disease protein 1-like 2 [Branchiostoma belcheri]
MTIAISGVMAQFVGVRLPGSSRTLQLCEVQVYTSDESIETSVMLGSPVEGSQSGVLAFQSPTSVRPLGLIVNLSVEITVGNFPPVTLHTILHVVPDDSLGELSLQCENLGSEANCNPSNIASTEALELYTESEIFGTTEFSLEEFPTGFLDQDWTSGIDSEISDDTRLRVLAGTFWAEGFYTIRLTDHHVTADADLTRIAEWRFNVLPTPEAVLGASSDESSETSSLADACTIMPSEGVSLIDKFCAKCVEFDDVLGPVEVTMSFQFIPVGVEMATAAFPGDGPPTDNRIFMTASTQWVPYIPLVDLATGYLLLTLRATSVDGRYTEFDLPPMEFLESNFNPFEYSNNSREVRSDVTGLGVKCGNRTLPVSGLSQPIDILTRRKNESLDGSIYVFETSAPIGNLTVFQFLVGKEQSTLTFHLDFNSTRFPQDISLYLRKGGVPSQDVFNWTATLPVQKDQLFSVGPLTNSTHIHCRCDHLTKFAGFVPPNPLNIQAALSANVLENPAGLVLVLSVFAAYLFGVLLTRKADRRDLLKVGVGLLPGHVLNPQKDCQYVITVYTGFRGNAGTTAEVTIVLNGLQKESVPFRLRDPRRVLFEKGSVDSFLVSTEEPLGELTHVLVWHSNQGYSPGWFLSQIVVTNRAGNNSTYFLCNRWLSVEKDDGKVQRIIPRAVPEDLQKFRNLFLAKSARDMNDGHLWFSVAGRPARSPFTRVQRLSCCLTLLYSTMLTNIMFFGRGDDFDPPEPLRFAGTEINPPVSLPQIMIGIQTAAIILPVNVLIVFLFCNSGPRVTNQTEKKKSRDNTKSSLPWWTVYIGWLLVWSASFVAAFFTVLYSLSFGRAKAEAWLCAFLTSFVTDLFLMQPFKLIIVAVIFSLISKKPVEEDDPPTEPLQSDEEFLQTASREEQGDSSEMIPDSGHSNSPPDESSLADQRRKNAEKGKQRAAVLEVLMFGFFIIIIMAASYRERSPMAFYMTQNVERQILGAGDVVFSEIHDILSCWSWITTGLLPALHAVSWYNGRGAPDTAVLPDMVSYPLGLVQLRQVRLSPGRHCETPKPMLNVTTRCSVPFSLSLADTQNYTSGWAPLNTTDNSTYHGHVCDSPNTKRFPGLYDCDGNTSPWTHTSVSLTDDFPYIGGHGSYIGGGYVTRLGTTNEATFLKQQNWLDQNTRALFIELILYNPHVNLFSVVSLVVEFTNLGSAYKSSEVITVRLIQHDAMLLLLLRGVLALFLFYFVLHEGKSLLSRPLEYLCEFWSWVELLVITVGFSTLGIYFHTQNIIDEVAEQRKNGNSAFQLYKSAVSWLQVSTYLQGLLISFATLKFIRLLRFNSHVHALSVIMGKSLKPITNFMFTVAIILMAFILLMTLTQGASSNEYKSLSSTLQSLLLMMLGSFDFEALSSGHRILGPLAFFLYQVVMQFILLSIFMVILFDVYENEDMATNPYDLRFASFLKEAASEAAKKVKDTSSKGKRNRPKMERHFSTEMIPKINRGFSELKW